MNAKAEKFNTILPFFYMQEQLNRHPSVKHIDTRGCFFPKQTKESAFQPAFPHQQSLHQALSFSSK